MAVPTIISSIVQSNNPQADGRSTIRELHTDSLGVQYTFDYMWDNSISQTTHLFNNAQSIIPTLAQAEVLSNVAQVTTFGSLAHPVTIYSTSAQNVAVLPAIYAASNQTQAIMLGDYLNSLSDTVLENVFSWTAQQVATLRTNFLAPAAAQATAIRTTAGG